MADPNEIARVKEIKRLLDRIQNLAPAPDDPVSHLVQGGSAGHVLRPEADERYEAPYDAGWPGTANEPPPVPDLRPQGERRSTISPWLFVLATALNTMVAAVLAVLITLSVVRQDPPHEADPLPGRQIVGSAISLEEPRREALTTGTFAYPPRAVALTPIGSRTAPMLLEAKRPARLPLQLQPEAALQETYIMVLAGLPAGANLSGASRISSDSWLLPPNSISNLEIVLPEWSAAPLEIDIELRRPDGVVATKTVAWLAVPPPAIADGRPKLDEAALRELLRKAEQLLGRGDIVAARTLYERAAEMGSAPAALALGSTYDPNKLWSLGVLGMVGNKERARQWYARAEQLGHPQAKDRLNALRD